jgi:hypothetical protein
MHARGSLPGPAVCMPLIPYLGPGRMRALRLAAASCHPAAVLRCAPPDFAHGLHVTPPRAFGTSTAPHARRAAALGLRACPSHRLACAAAAPSAPSSALGLTQRAAQRRMGLRLIGPPPRASRGRPGPQSGRFLSPPRLRRRRAHRAQLLPGLAPESVSKANGIVSPRSTAARVARPPWDSIRSIPLTSSPAPPPRPSRPALTWPCPRERLNGIAGTFTLRRARGPPIPQPRGPRSQAPRRRRPPLQKSSYCSHSPPEGTLAS